MSGPCLPPTGSNSDSLTSAVIASEGAGVGNSEADAVINKTTNKKKKKTRKVVVVKVVTHYEVHPLTLPPTVAVTPSSATVQVPTNTTLIMDMMDGVNLQLPSMASNVGPG